MNDWAYFWFASFHTSTSACQVLYYYVTSTKEGYTLTNDYLNPLGISDVNQYDENNISGNVNSNS